MDWMVPAHTCENSLIEHPGERRETGMRAMQAEGSPTPPPPRGSGTGLQAPSVMLTPVPDTRLPLQP